MRFWSNIWRCGLCVLVLSACRTDVAPSPSDKASSEKLQCGVTTTPISTIQGKGSATPLDGTDHLVSGVVTALNNHLPQDQQGFIIQSLTPDSDPATSEGLLIISDTSAEVGQVRLASGTVTELEGMTALIASSHVSCGTAPIPAPAFVAHPVNWEHVEGMRIATDGRQTVADVYALGRHGVMEIAFGDRPWVPTEVALPGEPAAKIAAENKQRLYQLRLPVALLDQEGLRTAASLPRAGYGVSGIIGTLSTASRRLVLSDRLPAMLPRNPRQSVPAPDNALRIASFNVENLFNGDGNGQGFPTQRGAANLSEYQRQLRKVTEAMRQLQADAFALAELENDIADPGLRAEQQLVNALNQASGRNYRGVKAPDSGLGSDAIRVGIIYDASKLTPLGPALSLHDFPFDYGNRPPLIQRFAYGDGQTITLIALHLKSKRCGRAEGIYANQGDGQACWNAKRLEAITALHQFVHTHDQIDPERVAILGDLNAYSMEDPLRYLREQGWHHVHRTPQQDYSYTYRGAAGSLDHVLLGRELAAALTDSFVWHINADETAWRDYSFEHKSADQFPPDDPYRSSDHDPIVVDLRLGQ